MPGIYDRQHFCLEQAECLEGWVPKKMMSEVTEQHAIQGWEVVKVPVKLGGHCFTIEVAFGFREQIGRFLCWQQSCKMQYRRTGCRLAGNGIRSEMNGTVMKCNVAETKWKR